MRPVAFCVVAFVIAQQADASRLPPVTREWPLGQKEKPNLVAARPSPSGREEELYSQSHALLIGESNYVNGFSKLEGVHHDMLRVGDTLHSHNFHVLYYADVRSDQLIDIIRDFAETYGHIKKARIVIYLSGHGRTLEDVLDDSDPSDKNVIGYFVPVDAPLPTDSFSDQFRRKAIRLSEIKEQVESITALHLLVLLDSCFSGSIFQRSKGDRLPDSSQLLPATTVFDKPGRDRVRMFISAGQAGETTPDPSNLARYFVSALKGEWQSHVEDRNGDGFLTGTEFYELIKADLPRLRDSPTLPQMGYGHIRDSWIDGDISFQLPVPGLITPNSDLAATSTVALKAADFVEDDFPAESACDDCGESDATETVITLRVPKDRVGYFDDAKLECKETGCQFSARVRAPEISSDGRTCTAIVKTWGGKRAVWQMRADFKRGLSFASIPKNAFAVPKHEPIYLAYANHSAKTSAYDGFGNLSQRNFSLMPQYGTESAYDIGAPYDLLAHALYSATDSAKLDTKTFTLNWNSQKFDLRSRLEADDEKSRRSARLELATILEKTEPKDVGVLIEAIPNISYRYALGVSEALGKTKSGWRTPDVNASIRTLDYVASKQQDPTLRDSVKRAKQNVKVFESQ